MIKIEYPAPSFRMRKEKDKDFLFDPLRKKWLLITPEEWVRQNFVQYLIQVMKYPAALIALEKEIVLGELKKRFDILVYDPSHQPWMMIECKEMKVKMDQPVLEQVLRYNMSVPVSYIVITNGSFTYGWKRDGEFVALENLPAMEPNE
jgi:hypothetical protein